MKQQPKIHIAGHRGMDSMAVFSAASGGVNTESVPLLQLIQVRPGLKTTELVTQTGKPQRTIVLHTDELIADWQLASAGETPYKIDPLR